MADSVEALSYAELARAYGLLEQAEVIAGEVYFKTHFGLAKPAFYQGDRDFLERLSPLLVDSAGKLGRLSLSRVLPTVDGRFSVTCGDAGVVLSTWETGPVCDTHNNFELFTVLAGVAHWHQQTSNVDRRVLPRWAEQYHRILHQLSQASPPGLHKRALVYWEGLVETWRNCLQEGLALLSRVDPDELLVSLVLGLESFSDFIYLADMHKVHYNPVYRCHRNLSVMDLAALLRSCEGDMHIAESMLLSYTKVRGLTRSEQQMILADLWFPRELTVDDLLASDLNILAIRRMQSVLEQRMALIADLEELLGDPVSGDPDAASADAELTGLDEGKVVFEVAERVSGGKRQRPVRSELTAQQLTAKVLSPVSEDDPVLEQMMIDDQESSVDIDQGNENAVTQEVELMDEEKQMSESELDVPEQPEEQQTESKPKKNVLVWKPFPRPLNAPPEPVVDVQPELSPKAQEQNDEADEEHLPEEEEE